MSDHKQLRETDHQFPKLLILCSMILTWVDVLWAQPNLQLQLRKRRHLAFTATSRSWLHSRNCSLRLWLRRERRQKWRTRSSLLRSKGSTKGTSPSTKKDNKSPTSASLKRAPESCKAFIKAPSMMKCEHYPNLNSRKSTDFLMPKFHHTLSTISRDEVLDEYKDKTRPSSINRNSMIIS